MSATERTITKAVYRPRLHYALLKFVHWPIIGLLIKMAVPLVSVSKLNQSWVFHSLGTMAFLLTFLIFIYKVLYLHNTKYIFRDEHLEITKGVFSVQNDYIQYYRIKDLKRFRSFTSRLIGTMDLTLITSDKFNRRIFLNGIANNKSFPNELREMVERERRVKGVYEVDR